MRLFDLLWWKLKSGLRKLRYDLGRELVVLFCSAVILALFFHIFNDFLNTQIAEISENMRLRFAQSLSLSLFFILAIYCGHSLYTLFFNEDSDSKFKFLENQSVEKSKILRLKIFWFAAKYIGTFSLAWAFSNEFLCVWEFLNTVYIQAVSILITAVYAIGLNSKFFQLREDGSTKVSGKNFSENFLKNFSMKIHSPLGWRLNLILFRKRSVQFCFMSALLFVLIFWFASSNSFPVPALFLLSLVTGWMVALGLCMQMSDDLYSAWFEQIHGMSHEEFLKIHKSLAFRIGLFFATLINLPWLFISMISLNSLDLALSWFLMILQFGAITFAPIFLVPQLSMQIDGKKWIISFISVVLISIFLATACFAHWLGIILFFLIPSFTEPQQLGRFYRA